MRENKQHGQISTDLEITRLRGIPAIAVAVRNCASVAQPPIPQRMYSETHAVGNSDSSSLQTSRDGENMVA